MDYTEIWYLGLDTKKIQGCQGSAQNSGYDDEHGSYLKVNRVGTYTIYTSMSLWVNSAKTGQNCIKMFLFFE